MARVAHSTSSHTEAKASKSSLLDSIETKAHRNIPLTYKHWKESQDESEVRQTNSVLQHLYWSRHPETLQRLESCGSGAALYYDQEAKRVVCRANHCHLRWCYICSSARSKLISGSLFDWLQAVSRPTFITLTIKHITGESLSSSIDRIHKGFKHFRRLTAIREAIAGGVWFLQTKRGRDGCWHSHIHIAADCQYIRQSDLSALWYQSTGDSKIVDIRAISDKGKTAAYVARYVGRPAKLSDFSFTDACEVVCSMHGRRLFGKFGSARQLKFKHTDDQTEKPELVKIGTWTQIRKAVYLGEPAAIEVWQAFASYSDIPQPILQQATAICEAYDFADS